MAAPLDPLPHFQDYAHPEALVSAAWLSARLGTPGLKVVESDEDRLLYDIGHIPTAVRIDWHHDLADPLTRDFIDGQAFAELMREKGISQDDTVVIYGDRSNWWAAYTFWVFKLFGHEDVRLLDGGRDAWMSEERDTSFLVPDPTPGNYPTAVRQEKNLRIRVSEVRAELGDTPIVDARSEEEFVGQALEGMECPAAQRGGHIPGALNYPWSEAVDPSGRFLRREALEQHYAHLDPAERTIVYCGLGDRSAHTWFVLTYLLGFREVLNYDGSWAEWGNMIGMPIATGSE